MYSPYSQARSFATTYTVEQLTSFREALLAKLQDPDYITAASTGGGTSYSRSQRFDPRDLLQVYDLAIYYLQNDGQFPPDAEQQSTPVAIIAP